MKRIVEHLDTRYVFHVRAVDLLRAALVTARALPVYQLAHLGPVAGAGSWWMLTVRDELRGTIEALAFDASALPNLRLRPQLVRTSLMPDLRRAAFEALQSHQASRLTACVRDIVLHAP